MQNIIIPDKVFLLKKEEKNNIINDKAISLNNKKILNCKILNHNLEKNCITKINVYCINFINQRKSITIAFNTDENNIIEKSIIELKNNMLRGESHSRKLSFNKRILSFLENHDDIERRGSTGHIKHSFKKSFSKTNLIKKSYTDDETMSSMGIKTYFSDKYVLLNRLGRGATATIKLAKRRGNDETIYVVKEFRKKNKNETSKEHLKKITSEFCIGFSLHHENIIQTFDLIEDRDGKWYEILEHCSGGNLFEIINSGKLKNRDILNCYFKQILFGVNYLHSMGVSHRDLKPENIILNESQQNIKIIDFGVSAVFRSVYDRKKHLIDGLCGSQPYISPEEYENHSHYDGEKVDIWACGVIYYFMLFMEIPWGEANVSDTYYQNFLHRKKDYFPTLDVFTPQSMEGLLRMLDPNPKTRISLNELIKSDWIQGLHSCGSTDDYSSHGPYPSGVNHKHVILHL